METIVDSPQLSPTQTTMMHDQQFSPSLKCRNTHKDPKVAQVEIGPSREPTLMMHPLPDDVECYKPCPMVKEVTLGF